MKASRRWWLLFGAGTLTVLLAMAWISVVLVDLDRAERRARLEASYQEAVRLSLWRMDSWLAPRLAPEAGRPCAEYTSFYPQASAYTRMLSQIEEGEVLTPSPLLTYDDEYFLLHFQIDESGQINSPQVPEGNQRDLAEALSLDPAGIDRRRRRLEDVHAMLGPWTHLRPRVVDAESCVLTLPPESPPPPLAGGSIEAQTAPEAPPAQTARSKTEWMARATLPGTAMSKGAEMLNRGQTLQIDGPAPALTVGPLVPLWLRGIDGEPQLAYVRRVQVESAELLQGILVDWPKLHDALLGTIADLFADARLLPATLQSEVGDPAPTMLVTLPASLAAPRPMSPASVETMAAGALSPLQLTLVVAWSVVILAVLAAALSLRASISYGERRSRFASAVTHELRTPLTTFRMYAEMLADGMITDPGDRQTYLETLKREAQRLGTLVENVLTYARLERGRATAERRGIRAGELLDRVVTRLQDRATGAGLELRRTDTPPLDAEVEVDVEAVGQILFNLVDNACKYAKGCAIDLHAAIDRGDLLVRVRDHGPGVPGDQAAAIFRPFSRGATNGAPQAPGIGLGLALSRGLARDLGGDLRLAPCDGGACFELRLPIV